VLAVLVLGTNVADAGRKRLVVMEFEGDEAEAIQKSFVKFLKKTHTVVSIDKWNTAAEELGATKINEKNVKKVAKKLKIDGIVTANVEKRREEYIIRIKLRSGASGGLVGNQVNAKTDETKLNKQAKTDIEEELFGQIDELEAVRGSGEDEESTEEEPEKEKDDKNGFKSGKMDDEPKLSKKEEEKRKKEEAELAKKEEEKRKKEEEEKKKKDKEEKALAEKKDKEKKDEKEALASKKDKEKEDEEVTEEKDDEETEGPKKDKDKKKKRVARDEEDEGIEEELEDESKLTKAVALSPGQRAIDVVVGLSFNMRRLSFTYDSTIGTRPAGYKGKPVPGGFFDLQVYPMSLGHKVTEGQLKNIGFTAFYDQVLLVKSQDMTGKELKSAQSRFGIGLVYRYPFGKSATSPVVGARLRYGRQAFKITQPAPLPNVNYTIIDPGVFVKFPITEKIILDGAISYLAVPNTGQMQNMDKYGAATVGGFEINTGADYNLTREIFLRGLINFETIRYSFKGAGTLTDGGKVKSASDSYYGAYVTAGYLF
jgi:hypothetical protein